MHYDTSSMVHCRSSSRITPAASSATFPWRSPPRLIHRSSSWRFGTSACTAIPKGLPSSPAQHW